MNSPFESLEPRALWSHFDDIRKTPRPSKHEEKISAHIEGWASERGFEVARDAAGSMTVHVPASAGKESAPTVILQGHLDMVPEKNADSDHDFLVDPIDVAVEGDWVVARGTTLGADNGVGLAAAMAVADDPEVVHGPLELLFTVDEETGLTGAKQLDPALVSGRIMLNLDTEEDGAVYIGCAGGADSDTELPIPRRKALIGSRPVKLTVQGLRGGHSGLNIIENRGNAVKLAARVLQAAVEAGIELDLHSLNGGSKHNAIPRECFAECRVAGDGLAALRQVAADQERTFREEFGEIDPDLAVHVTELDDGPSLQEVLNVHSRDSLLRLILALPHGVLSMSRQVIGLVETSNNLAVVSTEGERAFVKTSHRSSVMPALFAVRDQVAAVSRLAGGSAESHDAYPGWKPNPDSPIVRTTVEVFEQLFGSTPAVKAIHAGLECGLLMEKVPGMDAVSIGPQIENAHSPEEKVQISSVDRFYRHLKGVLAKLAG